MIKSSSEPAKIKVYKRRWYILLLYILCIAVGQFQWIQYSIISNIVVRYYNVDSGMVDWSAMVFMAVFPVLVIPSSYIIDKMGLRVAGLITGVATAVAVFIKVFSVNPDLFYLVLVGQTIVGVAQVVGVSLPPKLAVLWFPENEVSRACALGIFGMQLGCALGFILPPTIVHNHENLEEVGADLKVLCWSLAGSMAPIAIAMVLYFPKQPKLPPNTSRLDEEEFSVKEFFRSLKKLFTSWTFIIHITAFSISIGAYTVIGTLLNQFVLEYFENAQEDAGAMGLLMVVAGMVGTPIVGFILDKTHAYKLSCLLSMIMQVIGIAILIFALENRMKILAYIAFGILGTFLNVYIPAAMEFGMEITYPSTESTTAGILYAMSQLLGFLWTLVSAQIADSFGVPWSLASILAVIAFGAILTFFTPNKLKRQASFKAQNLDGFKPIPSKELI